MYEVLSDLSISILKRHYFVSFKTKMSLFSLIVLHKSFFFMKLKTMFILKFPFNHERYAFIRESYTLIREIFAFIRESYALISETNAFIRESVAFIR